jgi:thiamine pyrophosphokinase
MWRVQEQFSLTPPIVSSSQPVTLLGGAEVSETVLNTTLSLAPTLVAVDGGANALVGGPLRPQAVIGDFDSLSDAARLEFADILHEVSEQETTDFDKALRNVEAPLVIALGVSGGRLDHELAGLNVLVRNFHRRCIALGGETLTFLCPPSIVLDVQPGALVSLFPMRELTVGSAGLEWPTKGLCLSPTDRVGTSNRSTGRVTLSPDGPGLLVILQATDLDVAAAALLSVPTWARDDQSDQRL